MGGGRPALDRGAAGGRHQRQQLALVSGAAAARAAREARGLHGRSHGQRGRPRSLLAGCAEAAVSGLILRGGPGSVRVYGGARAEVCRGRKSLCVYVEAGRGDKIGEHWMVPVCTVSVACPTFSRPSVFLQDGEGCFQLVHGEAESSPPAYQGGG